MNIRHRIQRITIIGSALILFANAGCSDTDDGGGGSGSSSGDNITIEYNGTKRIGDTAVMPTGNYPSDGFIESRIVGGWAKEGKFGTVDVVLEAKSASGSDIGPGTYRLVHGDFNDRDAAPYASFTLGFNSHPELKPELYSRSGELVLEKLSFDGGTLLQIVYSFNGEFSERRNPPNENQPEETDGPFHQVSGRVQFGGK